MGGWGTRKMLEKKQQGGEKCILKTHIWKCSHLSVVQYAPSDSSPGDCGTLNSVLSWFLQLWVTVSNLRGRWITPGSARQNTKRTTTLIIHRRYIHIQSKRCSLGPISDEGEETLPYTFQLDVQSQVQSPHVWFLHAEMLLFRCLALERPWEQTSWMFIRLHTSEVHWVTANKVVIVLNLALAAKGTQCSTHCF